MKLIVNTAQTHEEQVERPDDVKRQIKNNISARLDH